MKFNIGEKLAGLWATPFIRKAVIFFLVVAVVFTVYSLVA
jgi:hypothetical protein